MKRWAASLLILATLLMGCGPGSLVFGAERQVPANAIGISRISMYQGVEVPLMRDGQEAFGLAPVVVGREGLVRIFVTPKEAWVEREIRCVLTIKNGDVEETLFKRMTISGASDDSHLDSTFNYTLTAEQITADTRFAVDLMEVDTKTNFDGQPNDSFYPAENMAALNAQASDWLEVVILPVRYNGDGSGRLPDTSEAQVQAIRDLMYGMYPATDVVVRVDPPFDWYQEIQPFGEGWDSILYEVMYKRGAANERPNTYYYGLFQPTSSIYQYCNQGCILGMSTVGTPSDVWSRASVGIGYSDQESVNTIPHEIGHAHGREHAPCGLYGQPSDRDYPHDDAELGTWGWDLVGEVLVKPDTNFDVMSYCDPMWVSDYTYEAFFTRLQELGSGDYARSAFDVERSKYRAITLHEDGSARLDRMIDMHAAPSGAERTVILLDDQGAVIGEETGHLYPLTSTNSGVVFIPDPGIEVTDVIVL